MPPAKNEFTHLTSLRAEALGAPGKRTFRLLVESDAGSAVIWLEKEQLFQLALAVQQVLAALPAESRVPGLLPTGQEPPPQTRLDIKAARLGLGHDGETHLFIIDIHQPDDEEAGGPATLRLWASCQQAEAFSNEALGVCAAGRPLCRLCSSPIDPTGHRCPRLNGQANHSDLQE